jgi:nucleoside recognition membrane protein YjiH
MNIKILIYFKISLIILLNLFVVVTTKNQLELYCKQIDNQIKDQAPIVRISELTKEQINHYGYMAAEMKNKVRYNNYWVFAKVLNGQFLRYLSKAIEINFYANN